MLPAPLPSAPTSPPAIAYEPRATGHVMDMVALIERIIADGHGYVVRGEDGEPTGQKYSYWR